MRPNIPNHEDDMNNLEQRLASWLPAAEGLNTDAMLYAAGRAAGQRGRIVWPALCIVLFAQVIGFGMWGLSERAERRALADRLDGLSPTPAHPPETAVAELPAQSYVPSPNDYLQLRKRAEQDPDGWLAMSIPGPRGQQPIDPPPPEPSILRGGQRIELPDL